MQCDGCECWLHQQCVGTSHSQSVSFSEPGLQFFRLHCARSRDGYNSAAILLHIAACAPDVASMRCTAVSERNLLQCYNIQLPAVVVVGESHPVHKPSVDLLRNHSPWLLDQFVPAAVQGDVNCLFRAVSLALYGHERQHIHLR